VHDLGKPSRFYNMLRVFKPTSPMSVGSWLLGVYGPAAGTAALSQITGRAPRLGRVGTFASALLGPGVASYTAALIANTAVPAWHEGFRQMPFVFVGSAAMAASGLALIGTPLHEATPARRLAVLGAAVELGASKTMQRHMGMIAEPYHEGRAGKLIKAGEGLAICGALGGLTIAARSRLGASVCGAALLAASACTRFGIFQAGNQSAQEPKYTVLPQRERLRAEKK
jgi:DMSO reductase anchor subunit